jgi:hypothetical protein
VKLAVPLVNVCCAL